MTNVLGVLFDIVNVAEDSGLFPVLYIGLVS